MRVENQFAILDENVGPAEVRDVVGIVQDAFPDHQLAYDIHVLAEVIGDAPRHLRRYLLPCVVQQRSAERVQHVIACVSDPALRELQLDDAGVEGLERSLTLFFGAGVVTMPARVAGHGLADLGCAIGVVSLKTNDVRST